MKYILAILYIIKFVNTVIIQSISCQKANINSTSNYYLNIQPSVQIRTPVIIKIIFPQYFNLSQVATNNNSFTVNNLIVTYTLPSIIAGFQYNFIIPNVINTYNEGSTGLFQIQIYKNSLLLQQNTTAAIIGIGGPQISLIYPNIFLDSGSLPNAGQLSFYNFIFSVNTSIPYPITINLIIPAEFTVPALPTCSEYIINNITSNISLSCLGTNNIVSISGYSNLILNNRIALKISLINPNKTGTTSNFTILLYKANTTYVVSSYYNIPGVVIQQGNMYSLKFIPFNSLAIQGKNKTLDYLIQFTPKNALSNLNTILIQFPSNFLILSGSSYDYVRIISGIENGILSWNNSFISILNGVIKGQIQIIVRLTTPFVSGKTNNLIISTFDNGILVDQDTTLNTLIQNINGQYINSFSSFSLTFNPLYNFNYPTTLKLSNLQIISPQCTLNTLFVTCFSLNGQIYIVNQTFSITNSYVITIINANYNPGTYLIDLQIQNSNIIQSSSFIVTISPSQFNNIQINMIDFEFSNPPNYNRTSIVNISFVTDYEISKQIIITLSEDITNIYIKAISGIIPLNNQSLIITKLSNLTMSISNFQSISTSTYVQIHLSQVPNPIQGTGLTITILNQLETTLSLIIFDQYTITLTPTTNPTLLYGYTAVDFNFSNQYIDNQFNLRFMPYLNTDINNAMMIIELPGYDTMFIPETNTIVCQINNIFYPCISYYQSDWILIQNISYLAMSPKPNLTIYGLRWPTYSDSVGYIVWRFINQSNLVQLDRKTLGYIVGNATFPFPLTSNLSYGYISVSNTAINTPGVEMVFTFQSNCLIPSFSTITLSFPSEFSLNTSNPIPIGKSAQFYGINESYPLTIQVFQNQIIFNNIKSIPALTEFIIQVQGIKIPNTTLISTNNFSINITKNNKQISYLQNFDILYYGQNFISDTIDAILYIEIPLVGFITNYIFQLTPYHAIPIDGIIIITFPSQANFINCAITGSISLYSSCSYTNNIFTITLAEAYYTNSFNISIIGITNPSTSSIYSYNITTYYDNTLLDTVIINSSIYAIQNTINLNLSVCPDNQGEKGTYTLNVLLTKAADTIIIQLSSAFSSDISIMTKFGSFINGVTYNFTFETINPPQSSNALITVISYLNSSIQQENDITFQSSSQPIWNELISVEASSYFTGEVANFNFIFYCPLFIESDLGGYIEFEFDKQFDCTYSSYKSNGIIGKVGTEKNKFILTSMANLTTTIVNINISITNPNISGIYNFMIRSIYNTTIYSESFSNLDFNKIQIIDIGPTFYVNKNQTLLVYQNTISTNFLIEVAYPSRYSFQIIPITSDGITVLPSIIVIYAKSMQVTFNISANISTGFYTIKWNINSNSYSNFYNPMVQTVVNVLECPIMTIMVQTFNPVRISGYSLPLSISIPFVPLIPLIVTLTFNNNNSFNCYPTTIIFNQSTLLYFTINSTLPSNSPSYFLSTIVNFASNHPNYTLINDSQTVISQPFNSSQPYISQLNVILVQKDSVKISIGTSSLCIVYLIVLPWFSNVPAFQNNNFLSNDSVYADQIYLTSSVSTQIWINNLTSSSYYTLYAVMIDQNVNISPLKSVQISTLPHSLPLQVLYCFNQPNLTLNEIQNILLPQISFFMSLNISYVQNPSIFFQSTLANTYQNSVFYQPVWIIIPDNYSKQIIINQLQNSIAFLSKQLNYLLSLPIIINEIKAPVPNLLNYTIINNNGYITVNVELDYFGTVFVCLVINELKYSYQMRDLANGSALLINSYHETLNISVQYNTEYYVYITTGDIGPLFPVLNNNFSVTSILTLPSTIIYNLNINNQVILSMAFLFLIFILI